MRILLLGSGGREHALAWRCAHEGHEVHVAPGSDGIASTPRATPSRSPISPPRPGSPRTSRPTS
jgi:phosphoribosylamine-glycine ligase